MKPFLITDDQPTTSSTNFQTITKLIKITLVWIVLGCTICTMVNCLGEDKRETLIVGFSFGKDLQMFTPIFKYALISVYLSFAYLSILAFVQYKKWNLVEPDAEKIMMAFDIMILTYKIIGVLTEIIVEMNDTISFQKFLLIAMILETILYLFFGITSSLLFYSNTDQSIITNFQKEYKGNYPIEVTLSILMISYVYQYFNGQNASLSFGKFKSRQNQEIHFKNHLCTLLNGIINLIIIQLTAYCILNLLQFQQCLMYLLCITQIQQYHMV